MAQDNTVLYVVGGLGLLYLLMKNSPSSLAAQQAALASGANLTSQQIAANQNTANVAAISGAATAIASDFSGSDTSNNPSGY